MVWIHSDLRVISSVCNSLDCSTSEELWVVRLILHSACQTGSASWSSQVVTQHVMCGLHLSIFNGLHGQWRMAEWDYLRDGTSSHGNELMLVLFMYHIQMVSPLTYSSVMQCHAGWRIWKNWGFSSCLCSWSLLWVPLCCPLNFIVTYSFAFCFLYPYALLFSTSAHATAALQSQGSAVFLKEHIVLCRRLCRRLCTRLRAYCPLQTPMQYAWFEHNTQFGRA